MQAETESVLLARRLAWMLLVFFAIAFSTPAQALECHANAGSGSVTQNVDVTNGTGNSDFVINVEIRCVNLNAGPGYLRYCFGIGDNVAMGTAAPAGYNPRHLYNWTATMFDFNLYTDPGRTQILMNNAASGSVLTGVVNFAASYQEVVVPLQIYGRIPPNAAFPAMARYQAGMSTTIASYFKAGSQPGSCMDGTATPGTPQSSYVHVNAYISTACVIDSASNMIFSDSSLLTAATATSQIVIRCPLGAAWSMGLGNGMNFSTSRQMRRAPGSLVAYELFKDDKFVERWGMTGAELVTGAGGGGARPLIFNVYGRVPAQPAVLGAYSDRIILTITY